MHIAGMHYRALIVEHEVPAAVIAALAPMSGAGRIIRYSDEWSEEELMAQLSRFANAGITTVPAAPSLRCRHVVKQDIDWYLLFNEERQPIRIKVGFAVDGEQRWVDPVTGASRAMSIDEPIVIAGHELALLCIA